MSIKLLHRLCNWIGKKTGTIILTPAPHGVGNCAEQIYFGLLSARREQKKLVILFPYELPRPLRFPILTNTELDDVISEFRYVLSPSNYVLCRFLLTVYFSFFRTIDWFMRKIFRTPLKDIYTLPWIGVGTLWQPEESMLEFSWDVVEKYDWRKQLATPLPVSIRKVKRSIAEQHRLKMGLPMDAWFVCLHVREEGFRRDHHVTPQRNAAISNYTEAIKEITSRGGWVVRMGDATMTRLPIMERAIDYPFTTSKSKLMDLYLISECRAYIGMQSGIFDVAVLFQRPIILVNMVSWIYPFPPKEGDTGLLKHIYSKSRGRFLSVYEWLFEPFNAQSLWYLGDDYVFHENSPGELKRVVKEYLDRNDGWKPTPQQLQFNRIRMSNGKKLLSEPIIQGDNFSDMHNRYRVASRLDSTVGTLGADFLLKNWDFDESLHSDPSLSCE